MRDEAEGKVALVTLHSLLPNDHISSAHSSLLESSQLGLLSSLTPHPSSLTPGGHMTSKPRVALMVTCLAEQFRPEVAFATLRLLRKVGCEVEVPSAQTCCGQPGFNSGARDKAKTVAAHTLEVFAGYEYVVAPSGSCTGMVVKHYVELFPAGDPLHEKARDLAGRTYELSQFLVKIMKVSIEASLDTSITYHDSCSGLRELGIFQEPRTLLSEVKGLQVKEAQGRETCCGFGGSFCLKYGAISAKMADDKLRAFEETGADTLVGGDLGCLLHLSGRASRENSPLKVRHLAEILDGSLKEEPMGQES